MRIIIVDPIFRASRLQYSYMVAKKANELGYNIDVITRTEASSEQYVELFKSIKHTVHEVVKVSSDFWFGKIPEDGIKNILDKVIELNEIGKIDAIYFAGGHEIFPNIADMLLLDQYSDLQDKSMVMIDYEPDFLLPGTQKTSLINIGKSIKQKLHLFKVYWLKKRKYENLFKVFQNFYVGILDERIMDVKVNKHFFYLPDPSPDVNESYTEVKDTCDTIKILIVGLQTGRKGFQEIIKLLNRYEDNLSDLSFLFVGRLADDTKQFSSRLKKSTVLKWEEGYFSEEKIREYYNGCDYVLMPYSTQFHGSSGVMAYSAAFRKPMITTSHGCIGNRNRLYSMGLTYSYGNIKELYELLETLPRRSSEEYKLMQKNCERFSDEHSVVEHQKVIFEKLGLGNIS